jgi:hypothetical protein
LTVGTLSGPLSAGRIWTDLKSRRDTSRTSGSNPLRGRVPPPAYSLPQDLEPAGPEPGLRAMLRVQLPPVANLGANAPRFESRPRHPSSLKAQNSPALTHPTRGSPGRARRRIFRPGP